jgi:hypothetical protein
MKKEFLGFLLFGIWDWDVLMMDDFGMIRLTD